ncbi:hypothetical protein HEP81_03011 [Streptomyces griseofuscus]|uniref:Uncharacterized protein n=1 Tax=Streptomyces griseofuscus TaxID=146922 RepID=A0A7H1PZ42_9ACTN|nr:hypothetical protein HEP81_03011 [Streptomyces griseofuscus]
MPMTARAAITALTSPARAPSTEPAGKDAEPGDQHPSPPEPAAQQARREHQRGEDDDVKRPRLG